MGAPRIVRHHEANPDGSSGRPGWMRLCQPPSDRSASRRVRSQPSPASGQAGRRMAPDTGLRLSAAADGRTILGIGQARRTAHSSSRACVSACEPAAPRAWLESRAGRVFSGCQWSRRRRAGVRADPARPAGSESKPARAAGCSPRDEDQQQRRPCAGPRNRCLIEVGARQQNRKLSDAGSRSISALSSGGPAHPGHRPPSARSLSFSCRAWDFLRGRR